MTSLVWLRQDLRLTDQPAIAAAAGQGPFAALYVLDDETPGEWRIGGAQRWWLHHSLAALKAEIERRGGALILRRGRSVEAVRQVADALGAQAVHATAHYEPWWQSAEQELGTRLTLHPGDTLVPPERVKTGAGKPYRIYGPFFRAFCAFEVAKPQPAPDRFEQPAKLPRSDKLEDWDLLPTRPNWAEGFSVWQPGEAGAEEHLERFADEAASYAERRDLPSEVGTSNLSAHLHFGEISPRQVWHRLDGDEAAKFRKEMAWRDFSRSAILADPHIGDRSQRPPRVRPRNSQADFEAWAKGLTGYPIVDAGMRQLWATGWMHNRVRMIAASFLVKHLLIDWRRGARWFWDTLVDADYGNNSLNWQWIAGTGIDSQPWARVMAPLSQSAKFGAAEYIRRWVPELAHLSDDEIHDPSDRGDYPEPRIGHREARERALGASRRP
ncbi:deoxyribodipyrimidine photo-lyase [Sphingomonas sinipercae]|uniref:Deoxyribodipyrimidine photo-lyase n=1 Tax=Sphingomonas sinipercae TaxID=2714944 RepID=A0A6G7ZP55_9SPHN|nr:deoxyribodipyrimidine photo-lyase [Sphingomonas sinipercae]QIL02764.1 deoxyribodipyrimidine photo-lyase [Sphingomonas sinipercae]